MSSTSRDPEPAPAEGPSRWRTRRVLLFLVPLYLFYAFPLGFWPRFIGANECANIYLAMALYDRWETNLDKEVRDYFISQDLTYRNHSFYSNKPPGPALWMLPAAFLVDVFTPGKLELAPLLYFGRLLVLSLPFLLFLFMLGRALERLTTPALAWGLTLVYALGSSASVYAVLYFSHNLSAIALGTAFLLLFRGGPWMRFLAGLACGLGVITEYQTLGIALVITVLAVFDRNQRINFKLLGCFVLGPFSMAAVLAGYNLTSFGGAGEIGYLAEFRQFGVENIGSYGFTFPSIKKLLGMLFSPAMGLFFYSPWLLTFFPAAFLVFRRRSPHRVMLIGSVLASLVLPLTLSSHEYWMGGAIAGPRYLAAGLPFMLFPIAACLGRSGGKLRKGLSGWTLAFGLVSAVLFTCILATNPYINTFPEHMLQNPVSSHVMPFMDRGLGMMTVAMVFGASLAVSSLLYGMLLLCVAAGYALPSLVRASNTDRKVIFVSCAAGLVSFLLWTQIGEGSNAKCEKHVNILAEVISPEGLPRENGRILFMKRASARKPEPIKYQLRYDQGTGSLPAIVRPGTKIFEIADGFKLIQGSLWCREGYLLCSDCRNNTIYKYSREGTLSVFRDNAGFQGPSILTRLQPGSNGLAEDRKGRLIITEYGRRRIIRLEKDGKVTVLAEWFKGRRLNSPSDVTLKSDGSLYFTDPPYGLTEGERDPAKELPYSGIFRLAGGQLQLLCKSLVGPTGLAFSPDEEHLYAGTWQAGRKALMRFAVHPDGTLSKPELFFDMTARPARFPTDGLLVDRMGNVYVTGNSGFWVLSPAGNPLGFIRLPFPVTSLAWGDEDARTLYIMGTISLYRMRVNIPGVR